MKVLVDPKSYLLLLGFSFCESSAFLRRPQKCAQSSLWFRNLLCKRQNHKEDFTNVSGLLRKAALYNKKSAKKNKRTTKDTTNRYSSPKDLHKMSLELTAQ